MIADPPSAPAVNPTESSVSPAVIDEILGALGVVRGVDVLPEVTAVPVPATFTALTRTEYAVPLVRPEIVVDALVDNPSLNAVHVEPFVEYSMM